MGQRSRDTPAGPVISPAAPAEWRRLAEHPASAALLAPRRDSVRRYCAASPRRFGRLLRGALHGALMVPNVGRGWVAWQDGREVDALLAGTHVGVGLQSWAQGDLRDRFCGFVAEDTAKAHAYDLTPASWQFANMQGNVAHYCATAPSIGRAITIAANGLAGLAIAGRDNAGMNLAPSIVIALSDIYQEWSELLERAQLCDARFDPGPLPAPPHPKQGE